jgi:serine/threonine-protein kinase
MAGLAGQTLDHYKLVEQVGQGGMATVFRAIDTRSQAEVAIKVLSPTITGDKRRKALQIRRRNRQTAPNTPISFR